MLLVAGAVALAWAVDSIANVLLVLFVALFGAVLSPVVTGIERRSRCSRGAGSLVLVLGNVFIASTPRFQLRLPSDPSRLPSALGLVVVTS